jgi:hypothetical protein
VQLPQVLWCCWFNGRNPWVRLDWMSVNMDVSE